MKLMVTGGRDLTNFNTVRRVLEWLDKQADYSTITLIHGGAKGADFIAGVIAWGEFAWNVEVFHADWKTHGRAAGPIRNQAMIDAKPDLVIAFPTKPEGTKDSGTWDAVARARKAGIPVWIVTEGCAIPPPRYDDVFFEGVAWLNTL